MESCNQDVQDFSVIDPFFPSLLRNSFAKFLIFPKKGCLVEFSKLDDHTELFPLPVSRLSVVKDFHRLMVCLGKGCFVRDRPHKTFGGPFTTEHDKKCGNFPFWKEF